VLVIAAASLPWATPRVAAMRAAAPGVAHEAELERTLPDAIRVAGGRKGLLACGQIFSHRYTVPRVAWSLRVHVGDVESVPGSRGVVLQARRGPGAPWLPTARGSYATLGQTKVWRVVASCVR
jgi:hypothetical protein